MIDDQVEHHKIISDMKMDPELAQEIAAIDPTHPDNQKRLSHIAITDRSKRHGKPSGPIEGKQNSPEKYHPGLNKALAEARAEVAKVVHARANLAQVKPQPHQPGPKV